MPRAVWNGTVLAESNDGIVVEGNYYFPPDSVNREYLHESDTTTLCPWKGTASYMTVVIDGKKNEDAAWYYPQPKEAAKEIENYVAFWRGVQVEEP